MGDFDDLNSYNGDLEHDMWVDNDYSINTGNYYYNEEEFEDEYQKKVDETIERIRKILSEACDSDEEQKRKR